MHVHVSTLEARSRYRNYLQNLSQHNDTTPFTWTKKTFRLKSNKDEHPNFDATSDTCEQRDGQVRSCTE
eukprot:184802-Amphidinium_carterae.1